MEEDSEGELSYRIFCISCGITTPWKPFNDVKLIWTKIMSGQPEWLPMSTVPDKGPYALLYGDRQIEVCLERPNHPNPHHRALGWAPLPPIQLNPFDVWWKSKNLPPVSPNKAFAYEAWNAAIKSILTPKTGPGPYSNMSAEEQWCQNTPHSVTAGGAVIPDPKA